MRKILFIGGIIGAMFAAGWFQIHREGNETMIKINRDEIRTDAKRAIVKGRELLDRGEQEIERREIQMSEQDYVTQRSQYDTNQYPAPQYNPAQYDPSQYPPTHYSPSQYPNQQYTNQSYPAPANQPGQYQAPRNESARYPAPQYRMPDRNYNSQYPVNDQSQAGSGQYEPFPRR
jgi:hypothetical protein